MCPFQWMTRHHGCHVFVIQTKHHDTALSAGRAFWYAGRPLHSRARWPRPRSVRATSVTGLSDAALQAGTRGARPRLRTESCCARGRQPRPRAAVEIRARGRRSRTGMHTLARHWHMGTPAGCGAMCRVRHRRRPQFMGHPMAATTTATATTPPRMLCRIALSTRQPGARGRRPRPRRLPKRRSRAVTRCEALSMRATLFLRSACQYVWCRWCLSALRVFLVRHRTEIRCGPGCASYRRQGE